MRNAFFGLMAALVLCACASAEHYDTTAAVNADPLCVSDPDSPDDPVARNCVREQRVEWNSEKPSEPVDFGGGDDGE